MNEANCGGTSQKVKIKLRSTANEATEIFDSTLWWPTTDDAMEKLTIYVFDWD